MEYVYLQVLATSPASCASIVSLNMQNQNKL
jgi:hypothetical protein